VAGYIVKASSQDQFLRLAQMIEYYLLIVSPPQDVANDRVA
jgi:hypothetical protein